MKDRRNEAPEPVVPAAPAPRARLADIARLAGVSSATADRVINHRPGVRTATMHRVLKVAAEMGYLPASDLMASLRPKPMNGKRSRDGEHAYGPPGNADSRHRHLE